MMSKILYKYPDKRRSQKTKASLVTDTGLKKNELYTDFVQHLTKKGKKAKAEKLFRKTLHIVEQKTKNPLLFTVLEKAVKNVEPSFFLKKARLGGASQQIPAALDKKKKKSASIRFLIQSAVDKQKKYTVGKVTYLSPLHIFLQLNFMKLLKVLVLLCKKETKSINWRSQTEFY